VRPRVPELPTLIVRWIADEYALSRVREKGRALILLQVDVCEATERAHGRQVGLTAIEQLKGGEWRSSGRREPDFTMEPVRRGVLPPSAREAGLRQ
jgi:hypothetical protein